MLAFVACNSGAVVAKRNHCSIALNLRAKISLISQPSKNMPVTEFVP